VLENLAPHYNFIIAFSSKKNENDVASKLEKDFHDSFMHFDNIGVF